MKRLISLTLALALCCLMTPVPAAAARETFTLMIYMCGTDLESDGGMATSDLVEMMDGGMREDGALTVLVQTGGTREWQNNVMKDRASERWLVTGEGLYQLESLGKANMGDAETLSDFLIYGVDNYPADRYGLILWNHGNGATGGVCYDEMTADSLDMGEIHQALSDVSGRRDARRFAFVGFDACLMGTVEMALHIEPYAEYMIASEELVPGTGYAYGGWLRTLRDDPGVSVETLGREIVDDFIRTVSDTHGEYATLALVDLDRIGPVREALERMGKALNGQIVEGNLTPISRIRQNVRSFGEMDDAASDMIDLRVFAEAFSQFDPSAAKALKKALQDAVVHNGHTRNLSNISGLSVLVPYATRRESERYLPRYDTLGLLPEYSAFLSGLVSGMTGGSYAFSSTAVQSQSVQQAQIDWFSQYAQDADSYYQGVSDLYGADEPVSDDDFSLDGFLDALFGDGGAAQVDSASVYGGGLWGDLSDGENADFLDDYAVNSGNFTDIQQDASWLDAATVTVAAQDDPQVTLSNPFANVGTDDAYVVQLSEDDLQHLAQAEANLMMDVSEDDFECYVELGYVQDVSVDWKSGRIYGLFDGTWPHLGGQMVCVYDQVANERYIRSLIPALLNGEDTYVLVVFDEENPGGTVMGTTEGYTDSGMPARGYEKLRPGDVVTPMYELLYWDDSGEQQSEPFEGDPITVGADGAIEFAYEPVEEDADYLYSFCLGDIYGEYQFTEFVTLSF